MLLLLMYLMNHLMVHGYVIKSTILEELILYILKYRELVPYLLILIHGVKQLEIKYMKWVLIG